MPYRVEVEKDPYFIQGIEKGKQEGMEEGIEKGIEKGKLEKNYEFVVNLLLEKTFTDAKISSLANVSLAFIEKVKEAPAANQEL